MVWLDWIELLSRILDLFNLFMFSLRFILVWLECYLGFRTFFISHYAIWWLLSASRTYYLVWLWRFTWVWLQVFFGLCCVGTPVLFFVSVPASCVGWLAGSLLVPVGVGSSFGSEAAVWMVPMGLFAIFVLLPLFEGPFCFSPPCLLALIACWLGLCWFLLGLAAFSVLRHQIGGSLLFKISKFICWRSFGIVVMLFGLFVIACDGCSLWIRKIWWQVCHPFSLAGVAFPLACYWYWLPWLFPGCLVGGGFFLIGRSCHFNWWFGWLATSLPWKFIWDGWFNIDPLVILHVGTGLTVAAIRFSVLVLEGTFVFQGYQHSCVGVFSSRAYVTLNAFYLTFHLVHLQISYGLPFPLWLWDLQFREVDTSNFKFLFFDLLLIARASHPSPLNLFCRFAGEDSFLRDEWSFLVDWTCGFYFSFLVLLFFLQFWLFFVIRLETGSLGVIVALEAVNWIWVPSKDLVIPLF